MAELGKQSTLTCARVSEIGVYLDGGELGEILLPQRYVPWNMDVGKEILVFVYRDSEDRIIATTETPKAVVGEFAALKVVSVSERAGAFLDWGLSKDLLLPFREQIDHVEEGETCVVYVMVDELTNRIIATERMKPSVCNQGASYEDDEEVDLLVVAQTPMGYKAVINEKHIGMLYESELSEGLEYGQRLKGYVTHCREDGHIDLRRDRTGYKRIQPLSEQILEQLQAAGGSLPFNDKSSPESIREAFDVSKQAFKQALGALYKQKRIRFEGDGIVLVDE